MNTIFSLYVNVFLLMCCSLKTDSYIILESEKSDEILMNSYLDDNQMDSNVLNAENVEKSAKFSENVRTFNPNQTLSTFITKHNQISAKKVNQKCTHSCIKEKNQLIKEEQYKQRLEYIKQQILHKLGMSSAPIHLHKDFDTSNYLQLLEASPLSLSPNPILEPEPKPESKESDKVFIFPTIKRFNIAHFNISYAKHSIDVNSIGKIYLFVRQGSTHSQYEDNSIDKELAVISTAVPVNGVLTRFQDISNMRVLGIVNPQTSDDKVNEIDRQSLPNWLQYDLTQILKPEVMKTNKLVSFDSEYLDMKDSVITVEKFNNNVSRTRRSIDCNINSTSCCRESFYVNFTTIGWDNWILQPLGYNANYCRGKCDISNARYHHTTVIGKYPAISLCCSPREMSHISLIYLDDKGVVFQKNLANMVVESCDCA